MALEDYKELVGNVAGICTVGQMLSGIFICKNIINRNSTKNVSAVPFIGGVAMSTLMMAYAKIINDGAMIQVNIVGLVLNLGYVLCYYYYTDDRNHVRSQGVQASGFVALLLGYVRWESPDLVEHRFGVVITVLIVMLISAPLLSLGEIVRTKSSESLPFPLIASGTLVSGLWLLYGVIIGNAFIQFQNALGLFLLLVQLSLFVVYPAGSPAARHARKERAT